MASLLFKWFLLATFTWGQPVAFLHPIFVSVTEISHNAKEKTLEISCRIFTDDFEQALRKTTNIKIDLLKPADKAAMDKLVNDYVQKHLRLWVGGKQVSFKYLGYEQDEEAVQSYFQAGPVAEVRSIRVQDDILFEEKPQQMNLLHITVNGNRKSTRLNNPDDEVSFDF